MERLVVDRSHLVSAGSAGELGFVVAGEGEAGGDASELEVFLDGGFQRKSFGAGEGLVDVDGVGVLPFEVTVEVESLLSVIRGGFEVGDGGLDLNEGQAILGLEMRGEFLVEVNAHFAVGVGNGDGAHGGDDEGNDVADLVGILLTDRGGFRFVRQALDALEGPG